ncbi:MAG: phage terminase large subunit family protein [Pseudomonadota bacterium]|nr:phage terminase large subunit family protein [Pseudomonadota bacterium]MDP1905050.1 phage terminase large subunit family protein [Pseudomonadota bacterium]MDP2354291.1 phage terminase large subunit family protein [Pseudomonadota bacterium]
MGTLADGFLAYGAGFRSGLMPDPAMWVDEWADEYMRIPRGNGAEPGKYRTERTPYAREVMRSLSPEHPAKRVVAMVASQMLKTQVGLNWLCASIHQAPGNMLVLEPSLGLAKRVSGRLAKTIEDVPVLRERVAPARSRDKRNTLDTKEFDGGTAYITTAGSAANLAEIPARYIYGDEVDRWEVSVDQEGDPVELAEARTSTFGRNAKIYYSSSPTQDGASRIADLFAQGDQRHYYVPCPHCGTYQTLEFERLHAREDGSAAYACAAEDCGTLIEEREKGDILARGDWRAHAQGDGETVSFTLSALYAPLGWVSWAGLCKQHAKAQAAEERGDHEPMQVFTNTRLARVWKETKSVTGPKELQARAEDYRLRSVPAGVLILTAAVDVQDNRLELQIIGWGEGMERWVLDYQVIYGDPSTDVPWQALDATLKTPLRTAAGRDLEILAVAIDSGGHHTHTVYEFCRLRKHRHILAVKGHAKPGRQIMAGRPTKVDITWRGQTEKEGGELWMCGTDTAKDWLHSRWKVAAGPGAVHFSADLDEDYYKQLLAEYRKTRYLRGHKITEWHKAKSDRNEALDLSVYNLACAYYLGLHRFGAPDWERWRLKVEPPQGDLFVQPAPSADVCTDAIHQAAPPPAPATQIKTDPAPAGSVVSQQHWTPRGAGFRPRNR